MARFKRTVKSRWRSDREAASGVVVTLLIMLVAVGALSAFMAVYVPIWGKDTESAQMKKVQTQLLGMKENIDLQILAGKNSTFATRFTLGDGGGPVFHLTQAVGTIALASGRGPYSLINTTDANDSLGRASGAIEYASQNRYFVDQKYYYENGALIIRQGSRDVMKAGPHFDIRNEADGNTTALITLISLTGISATKGGIGDMRILSSMKNYDITQYSGGDWIAGRTFSLNLTTAHPSAWVSYINTTLSRPDANLVYGTDFTVKTWSGGINATLFGINRLSLGLAIIDISLEM